MNVGRVGAIMASFFLAHIAVAAESDAPRAAYAWRTDPARPSELAQRRPLRTQWIWRKPRADLPAGGPALRVTVRVPLPVGWAFARAEGVGAEVLRLPDEGAAPKLVWPFQVDLVTRNAQFLLFLVNNAGVVRQLRMDVGVEPGLPVFRFDPSCEAYDWDIRSVPAEPVKPTPAGLPLAFGVSCKPDGKKSLLVEVQRPADVQWVTIPGKPGNPVASVRFLSALPGDKPVAPLRVRYTDAQRRPGEYTLLLKDKSAGKRWGVGVGASWTVFWYQETLQDLKLRQFGITAKASFAFQIIPRAFLMDATVFGTVFAFDVNPADRPELYTLGANGRLGYRLPIDWAKIDWTLYAGYYYWTTFVRSNSYGVRHLSGPQVFAQVGLAQPRMLPFYVYGKFATISDLTEFFSLSNYEVAVGGGIGFWLSPTALMFTFDLAHTQFSRGLNSMGLDTVSFGLTQRF